MTNLIKKYMQWSVDRAVALNMTNILDLLERNPGSTLLDCGCDDGQNTLLFARKMESTTIYGIEINPTSAAKAREKGVTIKSADLNEQFSFEDNIFDVICANQVIEHLYNTDNFLNEQYRVLRRGGTL